MAGKQEGSSYGALTISNNTTITDVDFSGFDSVSISNCSAIKSIVHSDNASVLTSLTINNCISLTSLTVYVDELKTLDLNGCVNLTSLTLRGSNFNNLVKLDLSRTKVAYITYDDKTDNTCLDLSRFTKLGTDIDKNNTYIKLGNNPEVTEILFQNSLFKPVYLTYDLQGCTKLRRVYGNISIAVTNCFQELREFSIHGSDLQKVTYCGKSVLDGQRVKYPTDISVLGYNSGTKVTNLTFNGNYGFRAFTTTNCTIFDYYYMLSNLGGARHIGHMFAFPQNKEYGFFDINTGNNPDVRLFSCCSDVTSVEFCFGYNAQGHNIYLKSPSVTNGIVTADDGLFSPLINCRHFSGVFYQYTYGADRFLFRRLNGNYIAGYLNHFTPRYIANTPPSDISSEVITQITSNTKENTGDLGGFFNNLRELVQMDGFLARVKYIDYTKNFKIPSGVTDIRGAFSSDYAYSDNFVLSSFFEEPSKVQYLRQSFLMSITSNPDYYVNMELNNSTFSGFTNLIELGYGGSGSYGNNNYFNTCFSGFNKTISEEFPMNIFSKNTKATRLSGVFMNAKSNYSYNNLALPGTMFANNTKLEDVSLLFYNMDVPYTLSDSTNFKNCPYISNLDYTFAQEEDNAKFPRLSGSIPYKFF